MRGESIAVVSGKGGMGKTMLVGALGALWAQEGKQVVLVDLNTGMRGIDMLLGMENRIVFDLGDVIDEHCEIDQALVKERNTGMRMIAARQICDTETLDEERLAEIVSLLTERFDKVILDAASGIGRGFTAAARAAEQALLITMPDDTALRAADRVIGLLQQLDMPSPKVILNKIREDFVQEGLQYRPDVCAQVLDLPICGVIPDDEMILRCTLKRQPALGDFSGAFAIENVKARLEDQTIPLFAWQKETLAKEEPKHRAWPWKKRTRAIQEKEDEM